MLSVVHASRRGQIPRPGSPPAQYLAVNPGAPGGRPQQDCGPGRPLPRHPPGDQKESKKGWLIGWIRKGFHLFQGLLTLQEVEIIRNSYLF